jgi:hypothetical protein
VQNLRHLANCLNHGPLYADGSARFYLRDKLKWLRGYQPLLIFFRLVSGVRIGDRYPLSAIIYGTSATKLAFP